MTIKLFFRELISIIIFYLLIVISIGILVSVGGFILGISAGILELINR